MRVILMSSAILGSSWIENVYAASSISIGDDLAANSISIGYAKSSSSVPDRETFVKNNIKQARELVRQYQQDTRRAWVPNRVIYFDQNTESTKLDSKKLHELSQTISNIDELAATVIETYNVDINTTLVLIQKLVYSLGFVDYQSELSKIEETAGTLPYDSDTKELKTIYKLLVKRSKFLLSNLTPLQIIKIIYESLNNEEFEYELAMDEFGWAPFSTAVATDNFRPVNLSIHHGMIMELSQRRDSYAKVGSRNCIEVPAYSSADTTLRLVLMTLELKRVESFKASFYCDKPDYWKNKYESECSKQLSAVDKGSHLSRANFALSIIARCELCKWIYSSQIEVTRKRIRKLRECPEVNLQDKDDTGRPWQSFFDCCVDGIYTKPHSLVYYDSTFVMGTASKHRLMDLFFQYKKVFSWLGQEDNRFERLFIQSLIFFNCVHPFSHESWFQNHNGDCRSDRFFPHEPSRFIKLLEQTLVELNLSPRLSITLGEYITGSVELWKQRYAYFTENMKSSTKKWKIEEMLSTLIRNKMEKINAPYPSIFLFIVNGITHDKYFDFEKPVHGKVQKATVRDHDLHKLWKISNLQDQISTADSKAQQCQIVDSEFPSVRSNQSPETDAVNISTLNISVTPDVKGSNDTIKMESNPIPRKDFLCADGGEISDLG